MISHALAVEGKPAGVHQRLETFAEAYAEAHQRAECNSMGKP
jgi:hypothetical protein